MDENKTDKQSLIPAFLDHASRTNPFGRNKSGERAYRRAERIVAAIYLLTNHISADEPLRRELRGLAPLLLQQILEFRKEMRSAESVVMEEFRATLLRMMSLVKILGVGGFISGPNAKIAMDALDDLGAFVSSAQRSELSEGVLLSREDFTDLRAEERIALSDIKDRSFGTTKPSKNVRTESEIVHNNDSNDSAVAHSTPNDRPLTARAGRILQVLRDGGEVGIRDIAANLPEYSEKMIQRELVELVQLGRVQRAGSKRWSRYSLVR